VHNLTQSATVGVSGLELNEKQLEFIAGSGGANILAKFPIERAAKKAIVPTKREYFEQNCHGVYQIRHRCGAMHHAEPAILLAGCDLFCLI